MSSNYIGFTPDQILSAVKNRFFYGLRRTNDGELFISKVDQVKTNDTVIINNPGDPVNNFPNFEEGENFYEGRNVFHEKVYENLNYEQFQWDNKNIYYYINEEGELVARINQLFAYDDGASSDGLGQ
jgi:ribosomal protein S4E